MGSLPVRPRDLNSGSLPVPRSNRNCGVGSLPVRPRDNCYSGISICPPTGNSNSGSLTVCPRDCNSGISYCPPRDNCKNNGIYAFPPGDKSKGAPELTVGLYLSTQRQGGSQRVNLQIVKRSKQYYPFITLSPASLLPPVTYD